MVHGVAFSGGAAARRLESSSAANLGDGAAANEDFASHSVTSEDDDLVRNCNYLLAQVGLNVKNIESFKELTRAAPSLLVAVYEALFQERLVGVVRSPRTVSHYAQNSQCVIDGLSKQIQMGLQHISGEAIALGERRALTNIVDILRRIVSITRGARPRGSHSPGGSSDEGLDAASGSLSTRASFYEVPNPITDATATRATSTRRSVSQPHRKSSGRSIRISRMPSRAGISRLSNASRSANALTASFKARSRCSSEPFAPPAAADLSNVSKISAAKVAARFAIENRLRAAKQRRQQVNSFREARAASVNEQQFLRSRQIFEKRAQENSFKTTSSFEMRRSNEQLVLQRQIFHTAVHKLNEMKLSEYAETKEKLRKMKEDADIHLQSMQKLFEDKIDMLNEKERMDNSLAIASAENKRVSKRVVDAEAVEKQREALKRKQDILSQRWEKELYKLRTAQESFLRSIHSSSVPVEQVMSACKDSSNSAVDHTSSNRGNHHGDGASDKRIRPQQKKSQLVARRVSHFTPVPQARFAAWR